MADQFDLSATLAKYVTKPSQAAKPEFIALYGRPGCGKTYLAATISQVEGINKVLILDTEGSTVGTLNGFDDEKIDIVRVDSHEMFQAILDQLVDPKVKNPYDAVIIDTFDVAQDRASKFFQDNAPLARSGEKDGFAAWGALKDWTINDVGQRLRQAPFVVIAVFHEAEEKMTDGSVRKGLALQGSAKTVWPGIPDMVVWLERKNTAEGTKTYAYFETEDGKVTKNRFGFPPIVEAPDFPGIFKYATRNNTKEN